MIKSIKFDFKMKCFFNSSFYLFWGVRSKPNHMASAGSSFLLLVNPSRAGWAWPALPVWSTTQPGDQAGYNLASPVFPFSLIFSPLVFPLFFFLCLFLSFFISWQSPSLLVFVPPPSFFYNGLPLAFIGQKFRILIP